MNSNCSLINIAILVLVILNIHAVFSSPIKSTFDAHSYRGAKSYKGDPYTVSCLVLNTTKQCASGVCPTFELCMQYLDQAIYADPTKNTSLLELPAGYNKCTNQYFQIPKANLHIFFSGGSAIFQCTDQFMSVAPVYPTDIVVEGFSFNSPNSMAFTGGQILVQNFARNSNKVPSITLYNVYVYASTSSENGGFISVTGYTINLLYTHISGSQSVLGSAIYGDGDVNIVNSTLSGNSGLASTPYLTLGGAVYANNIYASGVQFMQNYADMGGALYGKNIAVYDSDFLMNSGKLAGGSILSHNSTYVYNSLFSYSEAFAGTGGAIDCSGVACVINGTYFQSCKADNGGSINANAPLLLTYSLFNGSSALDSGGALQVNNLVDISNVTFDSCNAYNMGGVANLLQSAGDFVATDSLFYNSSSAYGGVLYGDDNTVYYLMGSLFQQNWATQQAGALYSGGGYPRKLTGGRFISNYCTSGPHSQTFNELDFTNIQVVNVSLSIVQSITPYLVPLVSDAYQTVAYGVTGSNNCINGNAIISINGLVTKCQCFAHWTGTNCNTYKK